MHNLLLLSMPLIWNKYEMIKEISTDSNIKTYLTRIEPIVKEIIPKDLDEFCLIRERIEILKNKIKIYDIIEEEDRLFIVIENNNEIISEIDKLLLSEELDINKEGILQDQGIPVNKNEILNLFTMEKSMCKIKSEKIVNNKVSQLVGSGFFCSLNNSSLKYALFTNNHVLDENNIKLGNIINFEYYKESFFGKPSFVKKKLKITEDRRVYTNKKLDYTCIELFESDGIDNFFKIDPILFNDVNSIKNSDIFILQYPEGKELCFSYGKIKLLKENSIIHSASTKQGSSGSPIIRRSQENYIVGLHYGYQKTIKKNIDNSFNLATRFDLILNEIP